MRAVLLVLLSAVLPSPALATFLHVLPDGTGDVAGTVTPFGHCTDVFGNAGGDYVGPLAGLDTVNGNFSADPLFCDTYGDDYTLQSDSPCAPPGVTGCGRIGAEPVGCGPVAVEARSWGNVKALYQ